MIRRLMFATALTLTSAAPAQTTKPKLIVVIAVDQFSADLFAEYRGSWTGGMKQLSQGVVFPSGYQSHAATETCPGHSTILTGDHPARTGVIANSWTNQNSGRVKPSVYCAEDETKGPSSKAGEYVPSAVHLRVPTLGDLMKAADPLTRVVAVAGKDRAAIMMAGHDVDQLWFLNPVDYTSFHTLPGQSDMPPAVTRANAALSLALSKAMPPMPLSRVCALRSQAVPIGDAGKTVGAGRFARAAGDKKLFRASPESDAATITLAGDLAVDMKLGQRASTDMLIIGASATDVIGHAYGTEGSEMCIQLGALDAALGILFKRLEATKVDYMVVLTADHGGHDAPERNRDHAIGDDQRVADTLTPVAVGTVIAGELGLPGSALVDGEASGDVWIDKGVPASKRAVVLARAKALFKASPQVADVFTADELAAVPKPVVTPEAWSLAERAAASFVRARSGDLVVLLRPRVTPITATSAAGGSVATHGSPWDYDRRVPILFWRKGMAGYEQPNAIETVDIAPTLAAVIGLPVAPGSMDGVCRALPGVVCP